MDESVLERKFRDAAFRRAEFLANNESGRANREFDKQTKLRKEGLRSLPDKGEGILKRLIADAEGNPEVLNTAASNLLAVDEPYAIAVLEKVAQGTGFSVLDAQMTIQEWKKGKLREFLA
jgi:hypothetical protein